MACRHEEEIAEQGLSADSGEALSKDGEGDECSECRREGQGMSQAPVAQRISVLDAEPKADDIEVG